MFKKIASNKENIEDNKNLIIQHNKTINGNIRKYRENVLTKNKNRTIVEEQRPNETQEEYLQQMKCMQTEQFDMNLYQEKANLHQSNMLKRI